CQFLTACAQKGLKSVKVEYIPGNHDRLCNCWPEMRRLVSDQLNLQWDSDKLFDVEKSYFNDGYPVFAFHGHVMDPNNYGGIEKRSDFLNKVSFLSPCLGDVVTVNLAVGLPWELQRQKCSPEILQALDTIDEVRPIKAIVDWVKDWKTNKMKNGARVDATIN